MAHANPRDIEHLVVLGHPGAGSFNHSIADAYVQAVTACGQTAQLRDLYALDFDPVLKDHERPNVPDFHLSPDIEPELALLERCSVVTLVYPLWFGMPPAIIKGYIDRVIGAGFSARQLTAGQPNPLVAGKRLVILSSSASTRPWLEEKGQWLALRRAWDEYLTAVFSFAGSDHLHFDAIVNETGRDYVQQNIAELEERVRTLCAGLQAARNGHSAIR